jgi:hypothetical protein
MMTSGFAVGKSHNKSSSSSSSPSSIDSKTSSIEDESRN